ncbi:MAG: Gfo/Idh/MocA family oxidoreductase [Planctomycetia bacterium]|nr:Gfo/Idh/MocA family oxidoreductase [Planctomycetia bacterium]
MAPRRTRRSFLRAAGGAIASCGLAPYVAPVGAQERQRPRSKNDRLRLGVIGLRYQGSVIAREALPFGDIVALCDVDAEVLAKARAEFGDKAHAYEDYRRLLERQDLDAVLIGTPDHWHAPMLIDACRAGKDVYCEKPLTLTVDEGKQIARAVRESRRVVQVGTWQRSDSRFRLAAEMVRAGRIGKVRKITIVLAKNVQGGPFAAVDPPAHFNWDLWQGQTPAVPYIAERTHYTFRWWHEYSGGQMTDWGAHQLDIAQWMLGQERSGPVEIEGEAVFPNVPDGYNVARDFRARLRYADGVEVEVLDDGRAGVMVEGEEGRIFVNRGVLSGKPVEQLADHPLPREEFSLYGDDNRDRPERSGKLEAIKNHMGNFYDCLLARRDPISDVASQHRSATACHVANISMRLKRRLRWDPQAEQFVGDEEANRWLSRPQRAGYTLHA